MQLDALGRTEKYEIGPFTAVTPVRIRLGLPIKGRGIVIGFRLGRWRAAPIANGRRNRYRIEFTASSLPHLRDLTLARSG